MLNTAQWAFDCRSTIPTLDQFKTEFHRNMVAMLESLAEFTANLGLNQMGHRSKVKCINASIADIKQYSSSFKRQPTVIVTSPPYPRVHVLYHRWQVQGRRETKAPYWLANEQDGHYGPYYSFGERRQQGLKDYFENALVAFRNIATVCSTHTWLVQMVAFSDASWQLPRYMEVMHEAGFKEASVAALDSSDGRLWREVPNRKWYTNNTKKGGTKEVVLFHRLK